MSIKRFVSHVSLSIGWMGMLQGCGGADSPSTKVEIASSAEHLDATAATDDKSITVPTASWWFTHVTPDYIADRLNALGARLTNLEVDPSDSSRFTVTMVKNAGAYAVSGWWWYYGVTASQLANLLNQNQARLLDLQKYDTSSGPRFAAVMVANTGAQARTWWWYHDVDAATLAANLDANGARLTSLKSRVVGGSTLFTAIMIKNSGSDAKAWWWYRNVAPSFVSQKLKDNGARLIDYERRANGNLDVVMVEGEGAYWWWYYGLASAQDVTDLLQQRLARPLEVERYLDNGNVRYAVVMIDNANAASRHVERTMDAGLDAGIFGAFLKKVGGGVKVDVQKDRIFEPASAIKVVYNLYANTTEHADLDVPQEFSYWVDPGDPDNKDVCPNPAWETNANLRLTTLRDGLQKMMMNSDNRTTRGFQKRYGTSTINAFIDGIGMASTQIRQIVGCGFLNNLRNDVTLADLGRLYEGVANGSLLTGAARDDFYGVMLGGPLDPNNAIATVIRDEAGSLGKPSQVATDFIAQTSTRSKGGSYDICDPGGCTVGYEYIRSSAGRIVLPWKSGGNVVPTEYIYGRWVNDLDIPCAPKGADEATADAEARCPEYKAANAAFNAGGSEVLRAEIRAALQTW